MQSKQRGALAEMNLQRGRPLRSSHTLEQEHWAQSVPSREEAPTTVFNGGKTTCIIDWVPDTELRPADVPLPDLRFCKRRTQGPKNLSTAALRFELEAV